MFLLFLKAYNFQKINYVNNFNLNYFYFYFCLVKIFLWIN